MTKNWLFFILFCIACLSNTTVAQNSEQKRLEEQKQRLLAEIEQSKNVLEQILQKPIEHFAYPNGVEGRDFDDVAVQWVAAAGFKSAVMTNWGYSTAATLPLRLKRFTPWDTTALRFHLRMLKNLMLP